MSATTPGSSPAVNTEQRFEPDPSSELRPMRWLHRLSGLRRCPAVEVEQNCFRFLLTLLMLVYGLIYSAFTGDALGVYPLILALYMSWAIGVFALQHTWFSNREDTPRAMHLRRILYTVGDRGIITWIMATEGLWIAAGYFLYLWVDIGNAARYGRRYMAFSTVLSALGFGAVLLLNPAWRQPELQSVGAGLWLGIVLAPAYSSVFFRRMASMNARLAELATRDPLTGLPNRTFFYERLRQAIATAHRHGRQFAVMFVDLDGFKAINDTRGHEMGDEILRATARCLTQSVRKGDTVARLGGDEFVLLLQDTSGDCLQGAGEAILQALLSQVGRRVSASVGIATYPQCALTEEALVQHADKAMYQAKSAGGRRCYVCPGPSPEPSSVPPAAIELVSQRMHLRGRDA